MATHKIPFTLVGFESNGAAFVANVDVDPLQFQAVTKDPATDGTSYWMVRVPQNYVGTPAVDIEIMANATTGDHVLTPSYAVPADGETMDVSFTAETAVTTTVPGTAYFRDTINDSIANTTPAVDDLLMLSLLRDADNASDTLSVDLHILGVWFSYSDA